MAGHAEEIQNNQMMGHFSDRLEDFDRQPASNSITRPSNSTPSNSTINNTNSINSRDCLVAGGAMVDNLFYSWQDLTEDGMIPVSVSVGMFDDAILDEMIS